MHWSLLPWRLQLNCQLRIHENIDGPSVSKYHPWDDKFRGDGISGDIERTKKSRNKRYWHKGYSRYSGSSSSSLSNNYLQLAQQSAVLAGGAMMMK